MNKVIPKDIIKDIDLHPAVYQHSIKRNNLVEIFSEGRIIAFRQLSSHEHTCLDSLLCISGRKLYPRGFVNEQVWQLLKELLIHKLWLLKDNGMVISSVVCGLGASALLCLDDGAYSVWFTGNATCILYGQHCY